MYIEFKKEVTASEAGFSLAEDDFRLQRTKISCEGEKKSKRRWQVNINWRENMAGVEGKAIRGCWG